MQHRNLKCSVDFDGTIILENLVNAMYTKLRISLSKQYYRVHSLTVDLQDNCVVVVLPCGVYQVSGDELSAIGYIGAQHD
jgi:hypothetical protein